MDMNANLPSSVPNYDIIEKSTVISPNEFSNNNHNNGNKNETVGIPFGSQPNESLIAPLPWYKCQRHIMPVLCFFAVFIMYLTRFPLSFGQIDMMKEFNWTEMQKGFVQSSFYIGYLPVQLLGGYFSNLYGGKYVNFTGVVLSCLACVLTPPLASVYGLLIVTRLVMGIGQGIMYPAMVELLSNWLLPGEKSFFLCLSWSGGQVGTIVVFALCPILNKSMGWRFSFYLFGSVGIIWCFLWIYFVFNSPSEHPRLSPQEKALLSTFQDRNKVDETQPLIKKKKKIPWLGLLTSPPVIALMLIYFSYNWSFYLFINNIPTYQENVLGLTNPGIKGLMSMLPYLLLWVSLLSSGLFSDFLVRKGVRTIIVRRLVMTSGFVPAAMVLFFMPFYQSSVGELVALCFGVGIAGIAQSGFSPNSMDLAPEFAGVITSICNILGSSTGVFVPIIAAAILERGQCRNQYKEPVECIRAWNTLFIMAAGIYIFGTFVLFTIFSTKRLNFFKENDEKDPVLFDVCVSSETHPFATHQKLAST